MENIRVYSISQVGFPSSSAQSVYDMAMAEAWADNGFDTTIVAKNKTWNRKPRAYNGNVWDFYGVKQNFRVIKLLAPPRFTHFFQVRALKLVKERNAIIFTQNAATAVRAVNNAKVVILDRHARLTCREEQSLSRVAGSPFLLGVVAVTNTLKDDCVRRIPQLQEKIVAYPNGVRPGYLLESTTRADNAGSGLARIVAGYLGSFHKGKGVEVIVEVARFCPDVDFHIYGGALSGNQEQELKARFGVREIPANVHLKGFVPQAQVPEVIASFDIALLPNQQKVIMPNGDDIGNWTSPMKMFEYMAVGKAILASDLPVLREVLEHRRNAYLVSPDNIRGWAESLESLRGNAELRDALGRQARQDIIDKFNWNARVHRIVEALDIRKKLESRPTQTNAGMNRS